MKLQSSPAASGGGGNASQVAHMQQSIDTASQVSGMPSLQWVFDWKTILIADASHKALSTAKVEAFGEFCQVHVSPVL